MRRSFLPWLVLLIGCVALAQQNEYPGPTILSRGLGTVLQGGGELLRIRPYLSMTGIYDTGLTPVSVDASGNIPKTDNYGGYLGFGVTGYHNWRRTVLGIDYRGNIRHYSRNTYYDGSDHTLMLGVTHQISRRLAFSLRQAAGTQSRNWGLYSGYTFFDPAYANIPTQELFDARVNYLTSMGDLVYAVSPRLSFSLGGRGMIVRRRSRVLVGVDAYSARGDMQYRTSRRSTLGVDYDFTHFRFTRSFGQSDIHSAAFNLAFQLGRYWTLALRAGGARVETLGLRRVAVDPIIAAITGIGYGVEVFYRLNYVPAGGVKLSRAWRRSTISFNGEMGVSPGNGIYLTSRHQSGGFGYSHTAFRRWNFGISGNYTSYSSLSESIGRYRGYNAGGGVSCQLTSWMHLVTRYDARRYDIGRSDFRRIFHSASIGLAFSPGELPLSLW